MMVALATVLSFVKLCSSPRREHHARVFFFRFLLSVPPRRGWAFLAGLVHAESSCLDTGVFSYVTGRRRAAVVLFD